MESITIGWQSKDLWFESQSRQLDFSVFLIFTPGQQYSLLTGIFSFSLPMWKFSIDLAVTAPQYLSAGTSIPPKLSYSVLV
jgi:hypothetical protein